MLENIDGLILESKFPQYQYIIKGPIEDSWRDGIPRRVPKHIVLEFDRHILFVDDLVRAKELTEEDKLYIARQLDYELSRPDFVDFWIHEKVKPQAPWPTYDQTHHNQIAQVAQSIGLVDEALFYELNGRPGGPRESVVSKLESLQGQPLSYDEDELAAV